MVRHTWAIFLVGARAKELFLLCYVAAVTKLNNLDVPLSQCRVYLWCVISNLETTTTSSCVKQKDKNKKITYALE